MAHVYSGYMLGGHHARLLVGGCDSQWVLPQNYCFTKLQQKVFLGSPDVARVATRHFAPCVELFTHISIVVITLCSSLNLVRNACIAQKN